MKKPLLFFMVLVFLAGSFYGGIWFAEYHSSDLLEQGLTLYPLTVATVSGDVVDFQVAIVNESAERTHGLQIVDHLRSNEGMWFAFEDEEVRRFWMKDMSIPLDIFLFRSILKFLPSVKMFRPATRLIPLRKTVLCILRRSRLSTFWKFLRKRRRNIMWPSVIH